MLRFKCRQCSSNHNKTQKEYTDVFKELGMIEGECLINLHNTKSVIHPPIKNSSKYYLNWKKPLINSLKQSLWVKTEKPTDWVNSIVTVEKR